MFESALCLIVLFVLKYLFIPDAWTPQIRIPYLMFSNTKCVISNPQSFKNDWVSNNSILTLNTQGQCRPHRLRPQSHKTIPTIGSPGYPHFCLLMYPTSPLLLRFNNFLESLTKSRKALHLCYQFTIKDITQDRLNGRYSHRMEVGSHKASMPSSSHQ